MFDFCYVHKNLPKHLFFSSFVAFMILNIIENTIHYSNGKHYDKEGFYFDMPTKKELIKIIIIMLIFAILQGIFTMVLYKFT